MADNGQIDNVYLNFEVGGNANDEFDKMDKGLENIENNAKEAIEALESFANISKIDVLNKKLENVNKSLDEAVTKNKGLDDSGVLGDLTKRFSLKDKLAKETAKTKPISEADYQAAENAIKKVSTEVGRLEEVLRVSVHRLAELKSQGKEDSTQFVNLASKIAKTREKLEELRLAAKQDALKALEWQIPDISLGDEQRANLEKIIVAAEGGSNAFDGIGESAKKAAVDVEYLFSSVAKTDYLENELLKAQTALKNLANSGEGYENPTVRSLISQIDKLQSQLNKITLGNIDKEAQKLGETINLMDYATKPMSRWEQILSKIKGLFGSIGNEGDKAFKKIDKSTKKAHNSSKNYNKGLRGLLETAKRFLVFGTFFTIQRQISQAFQEGTQNLYQYSKAIDGNFAQSMDRLATSFLYLKNAIGAAVAPIINAVTPALESLIDTVAEFGNKLAETFAALTGATTFKKAIKYHKEYAEAVNQTNNALAKFDEINNITTSKGKDELDYGSMFETAKVNVEFKNLNDLGKQLARKLNEQVKKLDEADIGKKIGTKINGALDFANGFISTFDFGKFSTTLFTEITDFIETINWDSLGELFSSSMVGVIDFLTSAVEWLGDTKNIDTLTQGIIGFIDGVEFDKIGESFGRLLKKAVVSGIKLLFKIPEWVRDIKRSLTKALSELIDGVIEGIFGDNWFSKYLKFSTKTSIKVGGFLSGRGFANGGYPASGEMFIARENGIPEMVGSIGGRTAVANNDQIVDAVSIGVYNAVVDAMSRSGGNKQPTIVQINGREVFRAVQDESTSYRKRTGQPAF